MVYYCYTNITSIMITGYPLLVGSYTWTYNILIRIQQYSILRLVDKNLIHPATLGSIKSPGFGRFLRYLRSASNWGATKWPKALSAFVFAPEAIFNPCCWDGSPDGSPGISLSQVLWLVNSIKVFAPNPHHKSSADNYCNWL